MNFIEWLDPGPRGRWLVLVVVIQVAAVILAATVVAIVMGRRRAAARHEVWLGALACTVVGPLLVVLGEAFGYTLPIVPTIQSTGDRPRLDERAAASPEPVIGVGLDRSPPVESGDSVIPRVEVVPVRHPQPTPIEPAFTIPVSVAESRPKRTAWFGAMVLVWASGVLIGLSRLGLGFLRLGRLRASARPLDLDGYADVLDQARSALRLAELPPIAASAIVSGPVAMGVLRPQVVLPEGIASALSPGQLRDVIIHECAHVVRGDMVVGLLQRLGAVVYWPHLFVHYMNLRLAVAREESCDNFVLQHGDPCAYARTLLELSERPRLGARAVAGVELMSVHWNLRDRIAGLLDPNRSLAIRPDRRASALVALALAATAMVVAGLRPAEPPAASSDPDRVIQGVVVDEQGRPVAGATVKLAFSSPLRESPGGPATTGADGRFMLKVRGYMRLEEELVASADGGARLGLGKEADPLETRRADSTRIVLKPSRSLKVHVQDAEGLPVDQAKVEAFAWGFQDHATTKANGDAVLRIAADAEVLYVVGLKPGVGFDYVENYKSIPYHKIGPILVKATLVLDGARTVKIKAVDSAGQPVPNIDVEPWAIFKSGRLQSANVSGGEISLARTDARGVATFDWLPPQVAEPVPFLIHSKSHHCPASPEYRPEGPVELEAKLLRCTPISGVVRQSDGKTAKGVLLRIEGRGATNHYCRMHVRTRDDGSYALDVYPDQSYIITVIDDRDSVGGLIGIVVREGAPRAGLDFTLGKGTLIQGRIMTEDGKTPPVGATITLVQIGEDLPADLVPDHGDKTESLVQWASTDAQGRYRFRAAPGRYEMWGPSHADRELLAIDGEGELTRDFNLSEADRKQTIAGVALEETPEGQRPIAGAIIEVMALGDNGPASRVIADDKGRFSLIVHPGRGLVLYLRDPAGTLAGFAFLNPDDDDIRVVATAAATLRGRVVDGEGRPQPGRDVRLKLDSALEHAQSGHFFLDTKTDDQGRYEFRGVVKGAIAEVWVAHNDEKPGLLEVKKLFVAKPEVIAAPDVVVPAAVKTPSPAEPQAPVKPQEPQAQTPKERYEALLRKYDAPLGTYLNDKDKAREATAGFLRLAREAPDNPIAIEALRWVVTHTLFTPMAGEAMDLLTRDHLDDPQLAPIIDWQDKLHGMGFDPFEALLRAAMAQSKRRDVQGQACLALARQKQLRRDGLIKTRLDFLIHEAAPPDKRTFLVIAPDIKEGELERLTAESQALLQRARTEYGDLKLGDDLMAAIANADLANLRPVAIGDAAPDTWGEDPFGKPLKLGDYGARSSSWSSRWAGTNPVAPSIPGCEHSSTSTRINHSPS